MLGSWQAGMASQVEFCGRQGVLEQSPTLLRALHVCQDVVRQGQALQAGEASTGCHIRPSFEGVAVQHEGLRMQVDCFA